MCIRGMPAANQAWLLGGAIRSDAGASWWLLRALLVSVPLLIEYEAVMTRAEHLKAWQQ